MPAHGEMRSKPQLAMSGQRNARRIERELAVLRNFISTYCRAHHRVSGRQDSARLCESCVALLSYAETRLRRCPYDPKPKCKHCPAHCYRARERAQIRKVMRFSGMFYVRRGRLDWLLRYFLS